MAAQRTLLRNVRVPWPTRGRIFTLSYKSSLPNQTLTVRWEKIASGGWIALQAATLQVFNDAPALDGHW